jgi:ankyrin repeat protein
VTKHTVNSRLPDGETILLSLITMFYKFDAFDFMKRHVLNDILNILDIGADPNIPVAFSKPLGTPIRRVITDSRLKNGSVDFDMILLLLKYGADINPKDGTMYSQPCGKVLSVEDFRKMVDLGECIGPINGRSSFIFNAMFRPNKFKFLYEMLDNFKLDINIKDAHGNSVIMRLLDAESCEMNRVLFDRLLEEKADLQVRNKLGHTVLHKAVICGNIMSVFNLIEQGVSIFTKDKSKRLPIDHAIILHRNTYNNVYKHIKSLLRNQYNRTLACETLRRCMNDLRSSSRRDENDEKKLQVVYEKKFVNVDFGFAIDVVREFVGTSNDAILAKYVAEFPKCLKCHRTNGHDMFEDENRRVNTEVMRLIEAGGDEDDEDD